MNTLTNHTALNIAHCVLKYRAMCPHSHTVIKPYSLIKKQNSLEGPVSLARLGTIEACLSLKCDPIITARIGLGGRVWINS